MDVVAERPTQQEMDRWLRGEDVGPEIDARCRVATEHLAYKPASPQKCTSCDNTRDDPEFSSPPWTCDDCRLEAALDLGPPTREEWDQWKESFKLLPELRRWLLEVRSIDDDGL
jgi:hypothetical protein